MPIYEYHCGDCGQRKDFLQKISDAPIDTCPACGSKAYVKSLTAAGFQLKGNGWYATDFKGRSSGTAKSADSTSESSKSDSSSTASSASSCNPGCACH